MKNIELKSAIIKECIKKQQVMADTYAASMEEAQQSANEYGNPEDWFDTYKNDLLNSRDLMSQKLSKILEDIKILQQIDLSKESTKVEFGSVVLTKEQNMIICVGLGKIDYNGTPYYAISPSVPIFSAIRDLKKGDTFEFRGKKIKILDVF